MTTPARERTHDVHLIAGKPRFQFRNDNRGVTLTDSLMAWTADGRADGASYKNIVSIRLQHVGAWHEPIAQCRITFADGYRLTLSNAGARGRWDRTQAAIYRDFVVDFHRRLAPWKDSIQFSAGLTETRYYVVMVLAILLGLMVLTPVVLLPFTRDFATLGLCFPGVMLYWPLLRMMRNNLPRTYQPDRLPEEVVR